MTTDITRDVEHLEKLAAVAYDGEPIADATDVKMLVGHIRKLEAQLQPVSSSVDAILKFDSAVIHTAHRLVDMGIGMPLGLVRDLVSGWWCGGQLDVRTDRVDDTAYVMHSHLMGVIAERYKKPFVQAPR